MDSDLGLGVADHVRDVDEHGFQGVDGLLGVGGKGNGDRQFDDTLLAETGDDLADDFLVGDRDRLAVLAAKGGVGEGDVLDDAADVFDRDRVADGEGPAQDDGEAGAVVGQRPLQGHGRAEGGRARERDQGRDADAEVAERDDDNQADGGEAGDAAEKLGQRQVDVALGGKRSGLDPGPVRNLEADSQQHQGAQDLQAVGDDEADGRVDQLFKSLNLFVHGVYQFTRKERIRSL